MLNYSGLNSITKSVPTFLDPLDLGLDDDDQHDYDSVASDEDTDSELANQNNNTQRSNRAKVNHCLFLEASARLCATVHVNLTLFLLLVA